MLMLPLGRERGTLPAAHQPPCAPTCPHTLARRVEAFVAACRELAAVTRGPDVMLTIGSDFQYSNAHLQ